MRYFLQILWFLMELGLLSLFSPKSSGEKKILFNNYNLIFYAIHIEKYALLSKSLHFRLQIS